MQVQVASASVQWRQDELNLSFTCATVEGRQLKRRQRHTGKTEPRGPRVRAAGTAATIPWGACPTRSLELDKFLERQITKAEEETVFKIN